MPRVTDRPSSTPGQGAARVAAAGAVAAGAVEAHHAVGDGRAAVIAGAALVVVHRDGHLTQLLGDTAERVVRSLAPAGSCHHVSLLKIRGAALGETHRSDRVTECERLR